MTTLDERPVFDTERYEQKRFTGVIETLDRTGDTKIMWDADNEAEVSIAKATFDAAKKTGASIFRAEGKNGEKGERLREFDETAERLIVVPQLVGG